MKIPFVKPPFGEEEITAVSEVMRTAELSYGAVGLEFQLRFAIYIGSNYAISCNSGTSALELVLQAYLRMGKLKFHDKVIIPSFTFVAVANAVVNAGLKPVFADIRPDMAMDLSQYKHIKGTRAIVPVHTFGLPCDMENIREIANRWGFLVIEDCAEALGAQYEDRKVGSFGDAAIYSFTPTKNMVTGEGGMITADDPVLAEYLRALRAHGIHSRSANDNSRDAIMPGHNYRLSEIHAAIGNVQLKKLDKNNAERIKKANQLTKAIEAEGLPVITPRGYADRTHVYQLYTIQLEGAEGRDRDKVVRRLREMGIEAKVYFWPPIHLQKYYIMKYEWCTPNKNTNRIAESVITLPMRPTLMDEEIDYMVQGLKEVLS